MMTRKATTQDLDLKLRRALKEIEQLKKENLQLLREREDNEEESLKILNSNKQLKSELSKLHEQLVDVADHRDQLLGTVRNFDQCSDEYERTLERIHDLEVDLRDANRTIQQYEEDIRNQEITHTQSLYEELVGSPAAHTVCNHPDADCSGSVIGVPRLSSRSKLRKYIKINNFIKKTDKLIKRQKCHKKNVVLRKQRADLIDSLELYSKKLEECRYKYEIDTTELNANISRLQNNLESLTDKYKSAQAQIHEHILAANVLIHQNSCVSGPSDQSIICDLRLKVMNTNSLQFSYM